MSDALYSQYLIQRIYCLDAPKNEPIAEGFLIYQVKCYEECPMDKGWHYQRELVFMEFSIGTSCYGQIYRQMKEKYPFALSLPDLNISKDEWDYWTGKRTDFGAPPIRPGYSISSE